MRTLCLVAYLASLAMPISAMPFNLQDSLPPCTDFIEGEFYFIGYIPGGIQLHGRQNGQLKSCDYIPGQAAMFTNLPNIEAPTSQIEISPSNTMTIKDTSGQIIAQIPLPSVLTDSFVSIRGALEVDSGYVFFGKKIGTQNKIDLLLRTDSAFHITAIKQYDDCTDIYRLKWHTHKYFGVEMGKNCYGIYSQGFASTQILESSSLAHFYVSSFGNSSVFRFISDHVFLLNTTSVSQSTHHPSTTIQSSATTIRFNPAQGTTTNIYTNKYYNQTNNWAGISITNERNFAGFGAQCGQSERITYFQKYEYSSYLGQTSSTTYPQIIFDCEDSTILAPNQELRYQSFAQPSDRLFAIYTDTLFTYLTDFQCYLDSVPPCKLQVQVSNIQCLPDQTPLNTNYDKYSFDLEVTPQGLSAGWKLGANQTVYPFGQKVAMQSIPITGTSVHTFTVTASDFSACSTTIQIQQPAPCSSCADTLLKNANFDQGTNKWVASNGAYAGGGLFYLPKGAYAYQYVPVVPGKVYTLEADIEPLPSGLWTGLSMQYYLDFGKSTFVANNAGESKISLVAPTDAKWLKIWLRSPLNSNVTVRSLCLSSQ
jgi:hypothetical protein